MGLFGCFHRRKKDKNKDSSQKSSKSSVSSGRGTQRSSSPDAFDDAGMPFSPRAHGTGGTPRGGTPSSPGASSRQQKVNFTDNDNLSRISEGPSWTPSTAPDYHHSEPPSAREAAFHGPPRFDWIDIETAAATKIQSVYRKNKTMTVLEKTGMSTSAIRNRKRRRKAANQGPRVTQSADTPSFFQCCAVGLAFGEATEDDEEAYRQFQKKKYEERVEQQQMHEDALRKQYLRVNGAGSAPGKIVEVLEVVE